MMSANEIRLELVHVVPTLSEYELLPSQCPYCPGWFTMSDVNKHIREEHIRLYRHGWQS